MGLFFSEAFITCEDPNSGISMLCKQLASLCSIAPHPDGCILRFYMGRAILRATENMLMIRVEADDLIGSYSIKTVIEGYLVWGHVLAQKTLLWVAAKVEPFASLEDFTAVMKDHAGLNFRDDDINDVAV